MAVRSLLPLVDRESLSLAYTPGVAEVCSAIAEDGALAREYTWRSRLVAVVSDGTAVLGLGNIGPAAALPVMEGKAALFSEFAGLNAVPIVLDTTDTDEIVDTVARIAPSFGGINLEDISAPRCFEIEDRLRERLAIPVFHDDQHGTAVVVLAALRNAATVTGRSLSDLRVVVSGAGAAGVACTKILLAAGIGDIAVADSKGILAPGRDGTDRGQGRARGSDQQGGPARLADASPRRGRRLPRPQRRRGRGGGGGQDGRRTRSSSRWPTPTPRCIRMSPRGTPMSSPPAAATIRTRSTTCWRSPASSPGRSTPARSAITENMKLAAAEALGDVVGDALTAEYIVPTPFDPRVAPAVAAAVAEQARADGVATA